MFTPNQNFSRRQVIRSLATGSLLFPGIVQQLLADEFKGSDINPLAPRAPHYVPRAKNVIFMYMSGGVSHMDTFDPKPRLNELHGKSNVPGGRPFLRSNWEFQR